MKRKLLTIGVVGIAIASAGYVAAHCEVPCGIYDDHARLDSMLEDTKTIAKAMAEIQELSSKQDALSQNQLSRWVATKEAHATATQHVITQYFMTQRIKPTSEAYVEQLTAAHTVLLAAMKCKQSVDPATAEALKKAVDDFHESRHVKKKTKSEKK